MHSGSKTLLWIVPLVTLVLFAGVLISSGMFYTSDELSTAADWETAHVQYTMKTLQAIKNHDHDTFKTALKHGYRNGAFPQWLLAYNRQLLKSCAPGAILFTGSDLDTTAAWYLQEVKGVRRDVSIVPLSLFAQPWFVNAFLYTQPQWSFNRFMKSGSWQPKQQDFLPLRGKWTGSKSYQSFVIELIRQHVHAPVHFSLMITPRLLFWMQKHLQVKTLTCQWLPCRYQTGLDSVDYASVSSLFQDRQTLAFLTQQKMPDQIQSVYFICFCSWIRRTRDLQTPGHPGLLSLFFRDRSQNTIFSPDYL